MADTERAHAQASHAGHEAHDINVRAIVTFVVVLTVVCILTAAAMLVLFRYLDNRLVEAEVPVSPLAMPPLEQWPEPTLLRDEPANLATYRAEETQKLDTYGWVDKDAGVVRIPIERAKALLLERGLPHR